METDRIGSDFAQVKKQVPKVLVPQTHSQSPSSGMLWVAVSWSTPWIPSLPWDCLEKVFHSFVGRPLSCRLTSMPIASGPCKCDYVTSSVISVPNLFFFSFTWCLNQEILQPWDFWESNHVRDFRSHLRCCNCVEERVVKIIF